MKETHLVIVVPCYNEQEVLSETAKRMRDILLQMKEAGKVTPGSTILFVNDGSRDETWAGIQALHAEDAANYSGISFSANRGHQFAVMAGLMTAREMDADATISIDADLQDDVSVITEMVDKYRAGAEIVYGVRKKRTTDTFFKRVSAHGFYALMRVMGVKTVTDHADYRLLGREALEALSEYEESHLFLRGLVPLLGYTTDTVYYDRAPRFAGISKYQLAKMLGFAVDGITSMSDVPIRLVGFSGGGLFFAGALWGIIAILMAIFGHPVAGTTAVIIVLLLGFGLCLAGLGIVGTYVGKTYIQSKHRPRYRIAEKLLPPKN